MSRLSLKTLSLILIAMLVCSSGCASRRVVIVNPNSQDVQLAQDVEAHVYVETDKGRVKSSNKVKLYEGQWIVTDPGK